MFDRNRDGKISENEIGSLATSVYNVLTKLKLEVRRGGKRKKEQEEEEEKSIRKGKKEGSGEEEGEEWIRKEGRRLMREEREWEEEEGRRVRQKLGRNEQISSDLSLSSSSSDHL